MRNSQNLFVVLFVAAAACAPAQSFVRPAAQVNRVETQVEVASEFQATETLLAAAARGDERAAGRAQRALLEHAKRLDRRAEGLFSGSAGSAVSANERYAKSTRISAEVLRLSAIGYRVFGTKKMREMAESIAAYLEHTMMNSDGAFYAGQSGVPPVGFEQDAYFAMSAVDRAQFGTPEIDARVLTMENALVIRALATLHRTTGDAHALELAQRAMAYLVANGRTVVEASNVEDSVAIGQAMIALYASTKDARFLDGAKSIADQIAAHAGNAGQLAYELRTFCDGDTLIALAH